MKKEFGLIRETKELCDLYHIRPNKRLGQNFLVNQDVYDAMIAAAQLNINDTVLEVGPGLGFLTMAIADEVKNVTTVELDTKLAEVLKARLELGEVKNVEVATGDVLLIKNKIFDQDFKVVANLPYNITSRFLQKFLLAEHKPESMTLLLQYEVGERLCARPGQMSRLGILAQYYSEPSLVDKVLAKDFYPSPEVDSAIVHIKLKPIHELPLDAKQAKKFFRMVAVGFAAKRKMLKKNLTALMELEPDDFAIILKKIGVAENARAQELSLDNWLKLFALLSPHMV